MYTVYDILSWESIYISFNTLPYLSSIISNVVINHDCHVKICDFGLCRSIATYVADPALNKVQSEYIYTVTLERDGVRNNSDHCINFSQLYIRIGELAD